MTGSIAVVLNPVGASELEGDIREALRKRGVDANWLETTEEDPGTGQARKAVEAGADVVIACGGDGTVRAVLESLVDTDAALAIVPAGTGNLLARNLDIPQDAAEAVEVALAGHTRQIDVGYSNGEAFAVMAGAGLDATIMRDTSSEAKDRFGSLAYVKTALEHLNDDRMHATVEIGPRQVFAGPVATVLAANHGRLQGGVDLFPESSAADGTLDVMAISASSIGSWLRSAWAIVTRSEPASLLHRFTGSDIVVTLDQATPYELDGEERPETTQLEFTVKRRALNVCVPEESS